MAIKYLSSLNLNNNELQNAAVHVLTTPPTSPAPVVGQIYYNSGNSSLYVCTVGGATATWVEVGDVYTHTTNANLTGPVTSTGNATAIANGAITNAMLANAAVATLSGTNSGDQTNITGNSGTATALATARTLTIGSSGKTFNGGANVSWTLAEMGAQAAGSYATASHTHTIANVTDLSTSLDNKVATGSAQALSSAANALTLAGNTLTLTRGDASTDTIDLSAYLDEDARAIASGTLNSATGVVTFTRDDATTFTLDLSDLLDDTNLVTSVAGKSGVVALVKGDVGLGLVDNTADTAKNVLSATKLTTAKTIGGVSFNGTANIDLPGVNAAGNQSTTGNAATATKLATPRTINGVNFDGTAAITVAAAAGTLTGTSLNSTITGSSLTSVGTLSGLTVTAPIAGSVTGSSGSTTTATKAGNIVGGLGGSIPYQTAVSTTEFIANGSAGQVLQSNGGTAAPTWQKRTYVTTIGNNTAASFVLSHGLATKDVIVQLYDNSSGETLLADVTRNNNTTVTIAFNTAPSSNQVRVLITKIV